MTCEALRTPSLGTDLCTGREVAQKECPKPSRLPSLARLRLNDHEDESGATKAEHPDGIGALLDGSSVLRILVDGEHGLDSQVQLQLSTADRRGGRDSGLGEGPDGLRL